MESTAFDGSRSRPKAAMLTAPTATLQTAKKSQPASDRNASLIIGVSPQFPREFLSRREVPGENYLAPVNKRILCPSRRILPFVHLLLLRWCGSLVLLHTLLHAGFVVGLHLLELRLLLRCQELVHLVVDSGLGHGDLSLNLRLLCGESLNLGRIERPFAVLAQLQVDLTLLLVKGLHHGMLFLH